MTDGVLIHRWLPVTGPRRLVLRSTLPDSCDIRFTTVTDQFYRMLVYLHSIHCLFVRIVQLILRGCVGCVYHIRHILIVIWFALRLVV